jgi:hypothetical protein
MTNARARNLIEASSLKRYDKYQNINIEIIIACGIGGFFMIFMKRVSENQQSALRK